MADALVPSGSPTPYCTVARLFAYHDWSQVSDVLAEDPGDDTPAVRPTRADLSDPDSDAGGVLVVLGLAACGEVEAACMAGRYYRPEDLTRLAAQDADGSAPDNAATARAKLEKGVADVWFWFCCQRRQPLTADPGAVPGYATATQFLSELKSGARLFGLTVTEG